MKLIPTPQNSLLVPKKLKWPQNKVKLKERIEGKIENNSYSTTRVEHKIVFEPYLESQNSTFWPQKAQQELGPQQDLQLREAQNIFQNYE